MSVIGSRYRGSQEFLLVYCKLIAAAQQSGEVPYKDVATILHIETPGHHMAREVGQILGEISEDEHKAGRPMLSAVAMGVNGLPGEGFFTLARKLGKLSATAADQELQFWKNERQKVYDTWHVR